MDENDAKQKIHVHLLKTRSSPNDNYEDYFASLDEHNYASTFIPVLEHKFRQEALDNFPCSPSAFRRSFSQGKADEVGNDLGSYGGIIFTSQRAVDAFASITKGLDERHTAGQSSNGAKDEQDERLYRFIYGSRPVLYVVGPATARSLQALGLPNEILGEETGNGDALAKFMLRDFNQRYPDGSTGTKPGLLFLVGEQRRDIIPKSLQSESLPLSERIGVDELVVYETVEMASFRTNFSEIWSKNIADTQWVVVFSPQGCKAMLSTLGMIDGEGRRTSQKEFLGHGSTKTYIATIGPTTRDYLRREFGVEPDVCAAKPSPEGVGDAIRAYMRDRLLD